MEPWEGYWVSKELLTRTTRLIEIEFSIKPKTLLEKLLDAGVGAVIPSMSVAPHTC